MGISDEVKGKCGKGVEARFRKLLAEVEGARRYFSRWRELNDVAVSEMSEFRRLIDEGARKIEVAELRMKDAEDASGVMAEQLSSIDEFMLANFRDTDFGARMAGQDEAPDMEPPAPNSEGAMPTVPRVDRDALAGKGPQTTAEKAIYLLGELVKIRKEFGGTDADKLNGIMGGKD